MKRIRRNACERVGTPFGTGRRAAYFQTGTLMDRPDPDELLSRMQRDEETLQRGRLKIFFGASASVGKTFAMLQAGQRRLAEGGDVVIGVAQTHGRRETAALLEELEVSPLTGYDYRGRVLREFDVDVALTRQPELILMDQLAHSNVQGTRHTKRW